MYSVFFEQNLPICPQKTVFQVYFKLFGPGCFKKSTAKFRISTAVENCLSLN